VVKVHREPTGKNFISISKENYSKAYRDMSNSSSALALYIWLVGNKDNYTFALSPEAIENQIGMARSSYNGAVKKLIDLGYLVRKDEKSNVYDFYEVTRLDGKIERKAVESEMIIFEDLPQENVPLVKHGEFTF
jgi:DNA-binding MarR family transcriptional regulator